MGTENVVGVVQWTCTEANLMYLSDEQREKYITGEAVLSLQGAPSQRLYNSGRELKTREDQ